MVNSASLDSLLVDWYRELRRFHPARDAHNIASRVARGERSLMTCSSPAFVRSKFDSDADFDHVLRTARVDFAKGGA